mgnify:CR=1 FL=1
MKIQEITVKNTQQPVVPDVPDFTKLIDKGIMEGYTLDLSDKPKKVDTSAIPDVNMAPEEDGWTRQEFPSHGVPYNIPHFWLRPLSVSTLASVHAAQQESRKPGMELAGFTHFLDALAPTIKNFDIRNLTVPDFYAHLYWLRINSYPASPFTVPWTSRYGNENVEKLNYSSFDFKELEMTPAEYQSWRDKGISFPTVRDMEVLTDPALSDKDRWLITYAQYVYIDGPITVDLMKKKIEKLDSMGPDAIALIDQFAAIAQHGVVEQIKVKDKNFELNAAIKYIGDEIARLSEMLEITLSHIESSDEALPDMVQLSNFLDERTAEYKELIQVRDNKMFFSPREEVVTLAKASAALLFP